MKNVKKIGLLLLILILLLFSWQAIADRFKSYELVNIENYSWADAEGKYVYADSAAFDGTGNDDMGIGAGVYAGTVDSVVVVEIFSANYSMNDTAATGFDGDSTDDITFSGTYTGTVDSFWAVQVVGEGAPDSVQICRDAGHDTASMAFTDTVELSVAGDSSEIGDGIYFIWADTTAHKIGDRWVFFGYGYWADSVRFGADVGHDTTSWATWDDTVAIPADSIEVAATHVAAIFDSLAGHTIGDRWVIYLFADDRDTIYGGGSSASYVFAPYTEIQYRRTITFPTATADSMIIKLYYHGEEDTTWLLLDSSLITASDTSTTGFGKDSLKIGPYYRSIYYLMGPEHDTETYDIKETLDCW